MLGLEVFAERGERLGQRRGAEHRDRTGRSGSRVAGGRVVVVVVTAARGERERERGQGQDGEQFAHGAGQ